MSAKQELFESVRSVVTGRLRDDAQVRELAHRVSEESTALRRRVQRAVDYARQGLRLEACAEAEAEPSVFELASAFDTDVMRQWRSLCAKNRLPVPEEVSVESLGEIEEAIAFTAPLRSRLALMRRLVLSEASAWHRLETLRELVSRDPDNPAWQDDRAALEPVVADELGEQFEDDLAKGRLEDAAQCVQRLEDGKWHWSGASRLAAQLRAKLDRAEAARAAEEAVQVVGRLEAEWSAENELGVRTELDQVRMIEQRLLGLGSDMPGELVGRIDAVERWLAARESHESARRENLDRVSELDRLAQDESSTLQQLRKALRAAEETVEGVPDDVRAAAERRIDALERAIRVRRIGAVAAVVLLLAAGTVATVMLVRSSEESARIAATASAAAGSVEAGRFDEAERHLTEAERTPEGAADPAVRAARKRLADAKAAIADTARRFATLMDEAGDPSAETARPERVDEAKSLVRTEDEQRRVSEWLRARASALESRRAERVRQGLAKVREVAHLVADATPGADPSWDGRFAQWEGALADIRRNFGDLPEVERDVATASTLIATQRSKVASARRDAGRSGRIADLGAASTSPQQLADALAAFAREHPDAPESQAFTEAALARAGWDALVSFSSIAPRPTAALARAPQQERDAAIAALDAYVATHPTTPFARECQALKSLLQPAPAWRAELESGLATGAPFSYWMIERTDGTRWYSLKDPRSAPWQPKPAGKESKFVSVSKGRVDGKAVDSIEEFQRSAVRFEGESPQMAMAVRIRDALADDTKTPNDMAALFAALEAIRASDTVDGAILVSVARSVVEKAIPELPEAMRPQFEAASRRLARERPDDIDWLDPTDSAARKKSAAASAAVREALQVDAWRKAYAALVKDASTPFATGYAPVGVMVVRDGEPSFLTAPGAAPASGTVILAAEPPVGDAAAAVVTVGTVGSGGAIAWEPAARALPSGTMLFRTRSGTAR
jgi:tetratricopeptide (TPR) repeat protein